MKWLVPCGAALLCFGSASAEAPRDTLPDVVPVPTLEVSTTRGSDRAPVSRSVLSREQVRRAHWGQDAPMAIAALPGAYAASDAGNGIGYSYLSLRGFPQRRIAVTVNGVPLNDPESHEVYWIDHPDLLASASEVSVTRGVGAGLYGAAAIGGAVNIETAPFSDRPRAAFGAALGSFATRRFVGELDSGPLDGGWNLHGRYSRIETDGYREPSWSRLWSYHLAVRRQVSRHSLRVHAYGGPEETRLAYLGVPRATLAGGLTGDADRDRRVNPIAFAGERDRFFEPHVEAIHAWAPSANLAVTQTWFYFDGRGSFDEQRFGQALTDYRIAPWATTDTLLLPRTYYRGGGGGGALVRDSLGRAIVERFDVVRRREVTNRHAGWVPRLRWKHDGGALTLGGELRGHDGRHVGTVTGGLPPGANGTPAYYDYHPRTFSAGLFAREEWDVRAALRVTADLAWRHQSYFMRGDRFSGIRFDQSYDFLLPRLGVTWSPRPAWRTFASYAYGSREPAFRDLYDAEGVGSRPLYRIADPVANRFEDPLIRPEGVHHVEVGGGWTGPRASASANAYRMDFRDELVYAGQFDTDLGYPILGNAARSVHQGVEVAGRLAGVIAADAGWSIEGNASFGDHHFVRYREQYGPTPGDEVRYDGNPIGFSPATTANVTGEVRLLGMALAADVRHAGRIYVDHTGSESSAIAPRTTLDLRAALSRRLGAARSTLSVRAFNVLDARYEVGGYMDFDANGDLVPHLIPAATRHFLAEWRVEF